MNFVDILALIAQTAAHLNTLATISQRMQAEGRTQLTEDEKAQLRAMALASEARLEAATR